MSNPPINWGSPATAYWHMQDELEFLANNNRKENPMNNLKSALRELNNYTEAPRSCKTCVASRQALAANSPEPPSPMQFEMYCARNPDVNFKVSTVGICDKWVAK